METARRSEIPGRIVTRRLILRKQERSDARQVLIAIEESHEELSRWLVWAKTIPSFDGMEDYISRARAAWELREQHLFHVFDHADRFLGACGLEFIDWELRGFEIGYWLRSSAVGKGYMTEAVEALEVQVFEKCHARRVAIKCDVLNHRSSAIAKRLGYELEGVHRNERINALGEPQDTMVWAKTSSESRHEVT